VKTLVFGAGPIGRWLALRLHQGGKDVRLLARGATLESLQKDGVVLVDGFTGERRVAHVRLVDSLVPNDRYDLVVVAMRKSSRLAVCPVLAANDHLENILFLGNDVSGFQHYFDSLSRRQVLLGFPGAGGGWDGDDLVFIDGDKPGKRDGPVYLGELDGETRQRTERIRGLFVGAGIPVSLEADIDGWLKYHFAFMGPTAGVVLKHGGDVHAVVADKGSLRQYILACREAGNVLRAVGYEKRQPPIFNLYYWQPLWLGVWVFRSFFTSRKVEIQMGLHAAEVGGEVGEMMEEFEELKARAGMETPNLDELIGYAVSAQ
jgi:2-dehydropantoate 2-reductase